MALNEATAVRLQGSLAITGFYPGALSSPAWDVRAVRGMEEFWKARKLGLPCSPSAEDVQKALKPLITETADRPFVLAEAELLEIGKAYLAWKEENNELPSWFSCNWGYVVGGLVVASIGGYLIYRHVKKS